MHKFKKYSSYKDSGIEWLGKIPEHWEVKRLGTLGRFSASGIDKHINKNESLVKIINFTDIYSNTRHILDNSIQYMEVTTPENNRIKHLVQKGDLIFLPSSETYEDLGLAALVNEELDNTSFSYHVIRLQFKKDIEHHFKKYLTNNNFVLNQFSSYGKGTTRKIIGRNVFKNVKVIPLEKQPIKTNLEDNTVVYLSHGDKYADFIHSAYTKLIRSKQILKVLNTIDRISNYKISKTIKQSQLEKNICKKIDNFEEMISSKLHLYKADEGAYIVEGHYHQCHQFEEKGINYLNLPSFACNQSYFIVECLQDEKFALRGCNV